MWKALQQFRQLLHRTWREDFHAMVLFGSQTAGMAADHSDIDLLLVHRTPPRSRLQRHEMISALAQQISEPFAQKLSAIVLSPAEAAVTKPYYLDMTVHCEILHDTDGFFQHVLSKLRARLTQLGAQRVTDPEGNPYWILKEHARPGEEIIL